MTSPHWRAGAEAWISRRLAERSVAIVGPVRQPRVRPWSTQLTVPTDAGEVWFKANCPPMLRRQLREYPPTHPGHLSAEDDAHLERARPALSAAAARLTESPWQASRNHGTSTRGTRTDTTGGEPEEHLLLLLDELGERERPRTLYASGA